MTFDFETLPQPQRYKLLVVLVVPRPIALVTSIGPGGIVNAAPFSFFNVFSEEPPLVVLGLQSRPDGAIKDTPANIRETGAFVVNLVDEALAEQMNICAVDFPRDESEIDAAGLDLLPGNLCVPHIASAPVGLECRHYLTLEVSRERRLCIGQVTCLHVRDGMWIRAICASTSTIIGRWRASTVIITPAWEKSFSSCASLIPIGRPRLRSLPADNHRDPRVL